eukprot:4399469-Pleurochrysis_carterae.AAC.3
MKIAQPGESQPTGAPAPVPLATSDAAHRLLRLRLHGLRSRTTSNQRSHAPLTIFTRMQRKAAHSIRRLCAETTCAERRRSSNPSESRLAELFTATSA